MGVLCSKHAPATNPYAGRNADVEKRYQQRQQLQRENTNNVMTPKPLQESMKKPAVAEESPRASARHENISDDEFYDGIPRFEKSLYRKSRSSRATKVGIYWFCFSLSCFIINFGCLAMRVDHELCASYCFPIIKMQELPLLREYGFLLDIATRRNSRLLGLGIIIISYYVSPYHSSGNLPFLGY